MAIVFSLFCMSVCLFLLYYHTHSRPADVVFIMLYAFSTSWRVVEEEWHQVGNDARYRSVIFPFMARYSTWYCHVMPLKWRASICRILLCKGIRVLVSSVMSDASRYKDFFFFFFFFCLLPRIVQFHLSLRWHIYFLLYYSYYHFSFLFFHFRWSIFLSLFLSISQSFSLLSLPVHLFSYFFVLSFSVDRTFSIFSFDVSFLLFQIQSVCLYVWLSVSLSFLSSVCSYTLYMFIYWQ